MPIKVETYQSHDGKFHATEVEAIKHEALVALLLAVPEIKDRWPLIVGNIDKIADALHDLAVYRADNHPAVPAHTTLEHTAADGTSLAPVRIADIRVGLPQRPLKPVADEPEDVGCDCGALLAGNGGSEHTKTCALEVEKRRVGIERRERELGIVTAAIDEHIKRTLRD